MKSPSVHYIDNHNATGQTVVLLHPIGLDGSWWLPVESELGESFRVVSVDLRGHGFSPVASDTYRLEDLASDVKCVLEEVDAGPAHIVGSSLGGMVAQYLALDYPDAVCSLVLAHTASTWAPAAREMMRARAHSALDGMGSVVEDSLERWFTPDAVASNDEVVERCRRQLLDDDPRGWAHAWNAIAGLETWQRLPTIAVPTLVISGELDTGTPPAVASGMGKRIPGAVVRVLEGAPHQSPFEQPAAFLDVVRPFLESCQPKSNGSTAP